MADIREQGDWYDNQQLYEMMVELSKKIEAVTAEMGKTQVMIRDYNGLRERLNECEKKIDLSIGVNKGSKDMWGYIVGGIGLLLAVISYANK